MNPIRTANLFAHLSLALAGTALVTSLYGFLPETSLLLLVYLSLLLLSWWSSGRWSLPNWAANVLGLVIALAGGAWILFRLHDPDMGNLLQDIPFAVAVVPYLGPLLMALTLVRVFRPRSPSDFWVLQGLGLLQVALACVLTSGTGFGILLLFYLLASVCALTAQERYRQAMRMAGASQLAPAWSVLRWLAFSLSWMFGVGLLAWPLFLFSPRVEGPEWEPLSRFGVRPPQGGAPRTGFSDEIDLTRVGTLENDDSIAFTVTVTNSEGEPVRSLPPDQRWRGLVLDRYEQGLWRADLNWPSGVPLARPVPRFRDEIPDALRLEFKVSGKTGGIFLADPVFLSSERGVLPVWSRTPPRSSEERPRPLFFEAGGTAIPYPHLSASEYRYTQFMSASAPRDRYPVWRVSELYQEKLLRGVSAQLERWTLSLLQDYVNRAGESKQRLRQALAASSSNREPLPPHHWEEVAQILLAHLLHTGNYGYSLTNRREDASLDPVLDFLVHVREGTCERFASALTLMLRSQGIPARIVKGFRGAELIGESTYYVRNRHAHAWVEAIVPSLDRQPGKFDWVILDPTPENEAILSSALSPWRQLQQSGQAFWEELIVGYNARHQADLWERVLSLDWWLRSIPWTVPPLVALLVIWIWRRQRRRHQQRIEEQNVVASLYRRLVHLLDRSLHLRPRPDETPRELALRATDALARQAQLQPVVDIPLQVVTLLYESRYGGQSPLPARLEQLSTRLADLEKALRS